MFSNGIKRGEQQEEREDWLGFNSAIGGGSLKIPYHWPPLATLGSFNQIIDRASSTQIKSGKDSKELLERVAQGVRVTRRASLNKTFRSQSCAES